MEKVIKLSGVIIIINFKLDFHNEIVCEGADLHADGQRDKDKSSTITNTKFYHALHT